MQIKQQKTNHSRLYDDCQYSIVQILEEMLFLCCQNCKASTAKKLHDVCYFKRCTRFRIYKLCRSYYFPYISNHQNQVERNYMAKESVICYAWIYFWSRRQEFISYNRMKMDTAIVRTFALAKSISLTFRAVKFVLFSRCLCGSNGSSQQLQFKVFFTITLHYYVVHSTKKCSLTCNWRQILIIRQDLAMVY